jgi:hypothetical protein
MSSSELKDNAVEIARYLQKPRPEWEDDNDGDNLPSSRKDTIARLLLQHKKHKDWSNLETNFKRELFKDGDLNLRKMNLSRRTLQTLDEVRKSMAEFKREKKRSVSMNPYMASNDSCYSLASAYSDKDSFTIYQRSTYRSSPIPSVTYTTTNGAFPLKSALKKSRTAPSLKDESLSIYSRGIENLSFINDDGMLAVRFREADEEVDDGIEMLQRSRMGDDKVEIIEENF